VAVARRLGLGVLVSLGGAPQACSIRPRPADLSSCPPRSARDLRAYAGYVRTIARRYRGRVRYYESWVEPNHRSFWPTGPDPVEYAALVRVQYPLRCMPPIRAARLILAGTGGHRPALPRRRPQRAGRPARVRPRRRTSVPLSAARARRTAHDRAARRLAARRSTGAVDADGHGGAVRRPRIRAAPRLWLTEFGWPGSRRAAAPTTSTMRSRRSTCGRPTRVLRSDPDLSFVQAAFWFNLRDYAPGYQNPDPRVLRALRTATERLRAQTRRERLPPPRRRGVGSAAMSTPPQTPPPSGPTPPDWYPDPEQPGQLRYWDGGQWTEHRSPALTMDPATVESQPGAVNAPLAAY